MKIHSKYPILLTLVEHDYLKHHFEDERTSADVYKALYLQGERLEDDRVVHWRPIAAKPELDERGVGWQDAHTCWISKDQQSFQVGTGQEPIPMERPSGLASSSGRYLWSVEQSAETATRLQQLDRHTGQLSTVWAHPGWASVSLAADPTQDRLLWSHSVGGPLQSWDPSRVQREVVSTGFADDITNLAFSADGRNLAFIHNRQVYCLSGGTTHDVSGPGTDSFHYRLQPSWSPDGKRLFYVDAHFDIADELMHESYQWMVASPKGEQRRALLSRSAVAAVNAGPALE